MTQEDSHNCIPDFDPGTETSYFAVYDGHGGAEVAQYCSAKLPDYLKSTLEYKDGQLADALQQAFLGFDATLRDDKVIKELKALAGVDDEGDEDDDECDPVGRTEADLLRAEADIPIEELVAKYGDGMTSISARKFQKDKDEKFLSPMIKAKRSQLKEGAKTSTDDSEENVNNSNSSDKNNSASSSGVVDPLVTRLDDKLANGHADNENNLNTEKELREAESVKSEKMEEMDTDKESKQKSVTDSVDSCVPDSSDLSNNIETVNHGKTVESGSGNIASNEADSTSVNDVKDTKVSAKSQEEEEKSEAADESKPSSSSDGPSGSGYQAESSGSGEPSGSSGPSKMEADSEPSGSGDSSGAVSSGSAGSSREGPSGSAGKKEEKTVLDEEFESEDESSEDEEYMEDSEEEEEEEEEEDEDEEELDEEEKQRIGGIFSKVIAGEDDDGHVEEPGSDSGCTAVVALLRKNSLVVANAGDSRCVLCRNGEAIDLSVDHKPEDDDERKRIEAAGGTVTADGRVNGGLNLSRALGDHWYKRNDSMLPQEQMISAWPDIQTETIGDQDEFIVVACDGIWNYMTSQEVVDFVKHKLQEEEKRKQLSLICEELFDYCLAPNTMGDGTGCDNMTCMIVLFNYKPTTKTPIMTDSSEADSSTTDEAQPSKETVKNSDTATEQKSSSSETKQQESSGMEKRERESSSEEGVSEAEAQPEKRARLEDTTVT